MTQFPVLLQYATPFNLLSPVWRLSVPMVFERQDKVTIAGEEKVRRSRVGRTFVLCSKVQRKKGAPLFAFDSSCPHDMPCLFDCYNIDGDLPQFMTADAEFLAWRQMGYQVFTWPEDALSYWLESHWELSERRGLR